MEFVLICDCDSTEFEYENGKFKCNNCDKTYDEKEAGYHLIGRED